MDAAVWLVGIGVVVFLVVVLLQKGSSPRAGSDRGSTPLPRGPSKPEPLGGMEGLDQYLERSIAEEAEEKLEEERRRERLLSLWAEVEPQVMAAIECVNKTLGEHRSGMHLEVSEARFVGRDDGAFGIRCKLEGSGRKSLGYDGEFPVVVYDEKLFIAGFHNWGEGIQLPIATLTFDALTNAIADGARWALEG
jgi:hypothetical protein